MPRSDGSVASLNDYVAADADDDSQSGPSDSTLIARSLAGQLKQGGAALGEDDTPLTTRAVRELQRSQRERVYARTLVRIRFPDRVCLQGFFHPRHTIADVYDWVRSSLNTDGHTHVPSVPTGARDTSLFELYTSPPRTVLHPCALPPSSSGTGRRDEEASSSASAATLSELRLVPAALIHLSWGPAHPLHGTNAAKTAGASYGASASTGAGNADADVVGSSSLGTYLSVELLQQADSKTSSTIIGGGGRGSGADGSVAYPVGAALVDSRGAGGSSGSSGKSGLSTLSSATAESKGGSADEKASEKSGSKPKWLKIGK
jgi:hypothetical protein